MAVPKINADECTGCEECVTECPSECIKMVNDIAVIDAKECTECSACVDACPAEAISE